MLPARPQLPSRPCPACGRDVDPLRADRVLWLEDGVRFLCGDECRSRFLRGERDFDAPARGPVARPRVERPSIPDLVREATVILDEKNAGESEGRGAGRYDPAVASGVAALALLIVLLSPNPVLGWLAAFLIVLCAGLNARMELTTVRAPDSLRIVAPLGLALAAAAGA
jgi:hypothetical protein